jgi:hypothetical protein
MISRTEKTKSKDGEESLTTTIDVSVKKRRNRQAPRTMETISRATQWGVSNRAKMNDFTGLIEPYDTMSRNMA